MWRWNPQTCGRAAQAASQKIEIIGMLWMQGERDSTNRTAADQYAENLLNLVASSRADYGAPGMAFIAGRINPPPGAFPFADKVRSAIETCPAPNYAWLDLDRVTKIHDNLHYDTPGTLDLGNMYAEQLYIMQHPVR